MTDYRFLIAGCPLLFCFLLWGCGVKRQEQSQYRETERMEMLRTDSLQVRRLAREWSGRKMEVQHIEFMEPDSVGRQFMQSVTLFTSAEEARGEVSSALASKTEAEAGAEREAEATQHKRREAGTKKGSLLWGVVAGIFCLAGLYVLFFYGKRT
ncbi:MAG: hypothetical protein LBS88_04135 [Tannerellaceae bacterium]|jgi:hypothetical protein|nr:hypothetical protein [Tannerellaceae bacterium]